MVALAAVRRAPTVREFLIAGHRSGEAGHGEALAELGLEPLLDLRLGPGGAVLALPLIEQAAQTGGAGSYWM